MKKIPKRLKKQLIIGGIYLGIFSIIFFIGFSFLWKKIPHKENGLEKLIPPQVVYLKFFKNQPNWGSVLVKIRNFNKNYGLLSFSYKIEFFDENQNSLKEIFGEDFIYPLEAKYLCKPKIEIETSKVSQIKISFFDLKWKKTPYKNSLLLVRQIRSGYSQPPQVGYFWVDGIVKNNSQFFLKKIRVLVILIDKSRGNEIGVGETSIYDLSLREERYFKIPFSKEVIEKIEKDIDFKRIEVFAYTNLMKF